MLALPVSLAAQERYAVIVSGAAGGQAYAQQYEAWTKTLMATLIERLAFDPARVVSLSESPDPRAGGHRGQRPPHVHQAAQSTED